MNRSTLNAYLSIYSIPKNILTVSLELAHQIIRLSSEQVSAMANNNNLYLFQDKAAVTGLSFNKESALFVATEGGVSSYRRVDFA